MRHAFAGALAWVAVASAPAWAEAARPEAKVVFVGAKKISERELRAALDPKLSWLDDEGRELLLQQVRGVYYDRGFVNVKVFASEPVLAEAGKSVTITIEITEGDVYKLKSVELAGELLQPAVAARRDLGLAAGEVFNRGKLVAAMERLRTRYLDAGYANVELQPRTQVDAVAHTISVTIEVKRGVACRFGSIQVTGVRTVPESVVRAVILAHEGEPFGQTVLERSKLAVQALGHFERVEVNKRPRGADRVDVELEVTERKRP